jgi:hypothetical protein
MISTRKLISFVLTQVSLWAGALRPLAWQKGTYGEKTCCLTSEEGFEFSAPMVVLAELRDACATMLPLGEVGAHGLAEEMALRTVWEAIGVRVKTDTRKLSRRRFSAECKHATATI